MPAYMTKLNRFVSLQAAYLSWWSGLLVTGLSRSLNNVVAVAQRQVRSDTH